MHIPVLQFINLGVILVMLVFLVKYVWDIFFGDPQAPPAWENAVKNGLITKQLKETAAKYPDKYRLYNFWLQINRIEAEKIEGDFAELGVYKGETAQLLHLMAPDRQLHLFDTFEGFTGRDLQPESGVAATYSTKNFADTSVETVKSRLGNNNSLVHIHAGYFPDSASVVNEKKFALVNIDADLYNPTKAGLDFFYPRLSPGGVIFIHDYNYKWEGLQKAVDEFSAGIPECIIVQPDSNSTVMIVKNRNLKPQN
jgi:O-methyltransferase